MLQPVAIPSLVEVHGERVRLNFHHGQRRAWNSDKRFVMVISGTQGGKTSFGPWWLQREIQRKGAGDYLAVTSTYDQFKLKMLPEMKRVFVDTLGIGRYWPGAKIIELRDPERGFLARRSDDDMWGRIILRSAQAESGLESSTANAAWLDELGQDEFSLTAWEAVLRRLSINQGRILGTTTPYNLGWLKQVVYDRWREGDEDFDVIQFASIVNPLFPREEFEKQRAKLADWKFQMFYMGRFTRPEGMIYNDFIDDYQDKGGHKVHPFRIPVEWPRVVGVDPGGVNLAMLWLAHDVENKVWYLYRENMPGAKSTKEYVAEALATAKSNHERVLAWYVGAKAETQQRKDWQAHGARPTREPPVADVEAGIDRVISLFRQHRLYVFDSCKGTLDQIMRYSRVLDKLDNPTEKIKDKETFHYLDALRYGAVGAEAKKGIGYG